VRLAVQLAVVGLSWDFNKDLERQILNPSLKHPTIPLLGLKSDDLISDSLLPHHGH